MLVVPGATIVLRRTPFEDLGDNYRCPQCSAFKKRFAPYDAVTGKVCQMFSAHAALRSQWTCILGRAGTLLTSASLAPGRIFCTAAVYMQRDTYPWFPGRKRHIIFGSILPT
jgi:hypothetical protein